MPPLTRRAFTATTIAAAASAGRVLGANDRVRVGFVGLGNRGDQVLGAFLAHKDAEVVAVCDIHAPYTDFAAKKVGTNPEQLRDYRKLLDRKDIDAVVVATPDHWHALQCVHACQAGKDVYCEKPLSLTIKEGRRMVEAARANKRVVQTGSQQRSGKEFRVAVELVRSGAVGKVHTVKVGLPKVNFVGPPVPDGTPPANLDYDRWLGPAPARPYNPKRVHYHFRFFWDYSGGQQTNFGAHHLDIAQWGLNRDDTGPVSAEANARFHPEKWFEVPAWTAITYEYADGVTMLCGHDHPAGTEFIGDKAGILVVRGKMTATPADLARHPITEHVEASANHHGNWLDCVRSREKPVADVAIGHRSATVCHLGNLAVRLGRKVNWNPETETVVGDAEAQAMTDKAYRAPYGA